MRFCTIVPLASLALAAKAPLYTAADDSVELVRDTYIVKLKDDVSLSARDDTLNTLAADAVHVYDEAFKGFSAILDAETLDALRNHPDVEYVEQDAVISVPYEPVVSKLADPWNLIRISHRRLNQGTSYVASSTGGSGTCIYVLDSGIAVTHPDFGGRASMVANFASGSIGDANGYGTAIAGVAAANNWGVSRSARIYGIRIFDASGSGTVSGVISGLQFVIRDAATRSCPNGVFVSFAATTPFSSALNSAAAAVVSAGHFVAAEAGATGVNVATVSPAAANGVCSVGSTDRTDTVSRDSNFGAIDIYAPGLGVTSLAPGGGSAPSQMRLGTPTIAGLASYIASIRGGPASSICNVLIALGTPGIVNGVAGGGVMAFNGNPAGN